jgi:hypothetical protein
MNKAVFDDKQRFEALDYCVRNFTWPLAKAMRDAGTPWVSPDGVSSALYTAVQLRVHVSILNGRFSHFDYLIETVLSRFRTLF